MPRQRPTAAQMIDFRIADLRANSRFASRRFPVIYGSTTRPPGVKFSNDFLARVRVRVCIESRSGGLSNTVLHKMMLDMVRKSATCRRLMTIPGAGAITAVTFLTTIDDPARFHRSRDVGAHLGLTPKRYASGETDRNGGISKCGDGAMCAVLYQSALALLTRSKNIPPSGFGGSALPSAAVFAERPSRSHASLPC